MAFGKRFWHLAVVPVVAVAVWPQDPHSMGHRATHDTNWVALMKNMETMHAAMTVVEPSGNSDADFVNLMLPHHQAAVGMARTELLYGSDPQMRRLAQEVITDQESEIQLMQLWLKQNGIYDFLDFTPPAHAPRPESGLKLQISRSPLRTAIVTA